jgi:hypothetical protein
MFFRVILIKISIALMVLNTFSEITCIPAGKAKNAIWEADTLLLGATMKVIDSTKNVIVIRKRSFPEALGMLYFIKPDNHVDSIVPVFHNIKEQFLTEHDTIIIGKFPKDTKINFLYTVSDTSEKFSSIRNKKFYTGQNRPGVDTLVSDIDGPFGRRWVIIGNLNNQSCEAGFSAAIPGSFQEIRIHVVNVTIAE